AQGLYHPGSRGKYRLVLDESAIFQGRRNPARRHRGGRRRRIVFRLHVRRKRERTRSALPRESVHVSVSERDTPVPIVRLPESSGAQPPARLAAAAASFSVKEWRGSGPATLHVHHADDEAWHVLEGTLHFRFADREVDVPAGGTVFVPAGVPHTYSAADARYLIVLTP